MRVAADEYDRTDEREAQYAACLLEVGPPEAIGWATLDGEHPAAPLYWRVKCECWFNDHCLQGLVGKAAAKAEFLHWYDDYKRWILEVRDASDN